jgi:hypothetical protein
VLIEIIRNRNAHRGINRRLVNLANFAGHALWPLLTFWSRWPLRSRWAWHWLHRWRLYWGRGGKRRQWRGLLCRWLLRCRRHWPKDDVRPAWLIATLATLLTALALLTILELVAALALAVLLAAPLRINVRSE